MDRHEQKTDCDVFVIGGGPGGSSVGTLLAREGWRTLVAERERHPRFHIGESLLPLTLPILERLGVREDVERIGIVKRGAEFVSPYHDSSRHFRFEHALDDDYPYAYEVRRAEFDALLFRNCARAGADCREGFRVTDVDLGGGETALVTAVDSQGTTRQWRARQVIDASGRDTFLGQRVARKRHSRRHNSAAVFSHFEGVVRLPPPHEGDISLFWFDHGWLWLIPFRDGGASVGAVCWPDYLKTRRGSLDAFLLDTIRRCPALAARMTAARMSIPATAAGNYSYEMDRLAGPRYVLLGDAYAFVDPVFSSGVHLALNGAGMAAEVVDARLRRQRGRARRLERRYRRITRSTLRTFSWFIHRVTQPAFRELFMNPRNYFRTQQAVISVLAGDLYRGTPVKQRLMLFKAVYYYNFLRRWGANRRQYRRRRLAASAACGSGRRGTSHSRKE